MRSVVVVVVLFALGCDSKATATDPQQAGARAEQQSKEYESCGATAHCADNLRCFDHTCRRLTRSRVGDYYAAAGAAARGVGEHDKAVEAYASALAQYDAEKVPVPPDVDCAYGAALASAKANREHAELAARVLHRCVLAVPTSSSLRFKALTSLATLGDSGLDPLLLGAQKTGDLYLTKGPVAPDTDKLVVTVTSPNPPAKSMQAIVAKFAEPDVRRTLVTCWEQLHNASKKLVLTAAVGVKSAYYPAEYEDEPGRYGLKFEDGPALPPGAEATADNCVRQIVEPAITSLKLREGFNTKLIVTIK